MNRRFMGVWTLYLATVLPAISAPNAYAVFGFSASAALNSGAATDGTSSDEDPTVAADGAGTWIAVWSSSNNLGGSGTDTDVHFARSTDNGATWSAAARLNSYAANDEYGDFQPEVAGDGNGNWVCVWYSNYNLNGSGVNDPDIFASYSTDDGQTWSGAVVVNSNAAADGTSKDEYASVVTDGKGHWICSWHSDNDLGTSDRDDYDILLARSSDNGATWSNVQALNSDAATDTVYDQDPRVETDRAGTWIAVWESENSLGGTIGDDGDLLYSISTDNGETWTANAALNADAATDTGYETFPSIATDRIGNWVVVWEGKIDIAKTESTDYETVSARSNNNGATWKAPVAVNNDAVTDDDYDSSPSVSTDGAGTWIAIWRKDGDAQSPFGNDNDIVASMSTDKGATWTELDAINTSMTTDSGGDDINALASDRGGHWVAVWRSNDSLGGTVGTDVDILTCGLTIDVPIITITKPNGGGKWQIGDRETVAWQSTGDAGDNVVIDLLKNGNVVETIASRTKNDGKYKWTVPNSVVTGGKYKVRVSSKSNANIADESDDTFKVK